MSTKIIKAWINGAIQEIEIEDIISPEQGLSVEDRLIELEDKPIVTDGNLLVGNGTDELEEMTPEEVLSHINGASVMTMTTEEYEALDESETNANTLYMLTDVEDVSVYVQNDEPVDAPDGSMWLDMDEEEINGMDIMVPPATAEVGQTIVVKSIDENGKPIEWEAVDNLRYVASDTEPSDTNVVWIDTSDNTDDFEQVVVDPSLTQNGWAADAKVTGDTISTITTQLNNMTSKLNSMIYVGGVAPTNAVDGMVWIDISESQTTNNEVI